MDMNEIDLAKQVFRQGAPAPPFPWMTVLRSHCVTLSEMAPNVVSAISVTTQLTGDRTDEANAVRRLSQLLADEFGFTTVARVNGRGVSVRFACADLRPRR